MNIDYFTIDFSTQSMMEWNGLINRHFEYDNFFFFIISYVRIYIRECNAQIIVFTKSEN